jgi:glycosyltransferase involved in cell wall biosynthesis
MAGSLIPPLSIEVKQIMDSKINPAIKKRPELVTNVISQQRVYLSIVIPLFNEEENIQELNAKLMELASHLDHNYEVIYVDDGSTDNTFSVLKNLIQIHSNIKLIRLRRNFGQTAAFSAGFDHSRGEIIVTMDGDLQNDPADIPKLLEKIEEGFDIASGWRKNRKDKLISRKIPSRIANGLISYVTSVKLHDYGCSLKAYRGEVVKHIHLYGDLHRFIPALARWIGIRVIEVPVNHYPRRHGKSKYGLGRTVKVILDLLTVKFLLDYATRPIQIFGLAGLVSFMGGISIAAYLTIQRIFLGQALSDRPILLFAVLLIFLGVQLLTMGLFGELLVRTYHETQGKPIYFVRDVWESDLPVKEKRDE